ncbi:hypothetical protein HanPI659440_Chr10g0376071 [Helianthus annuus]|nr:hypothetical protein HanPI659440_Chr10g0376071 [Helianthus annuus]
MVRQIEFKGYQRSIEQKSQNRSNRTFCFSSNFGGLWLCGGAAFTESQNRSYDETKIQKTS